jgi:hypothetical protein
MRFEVPQETKTAAAREVSFHKWLFVIIVKSKKSSVRFEDRPYSIKDL